MKAEGREPVREKGYMIWTGFLLPCLVTSALKMHTACFSKMLAQTYKTT
jgi:hypothetical protein